MTNITLVNNQHTTTLQTTPGTNNNLVKLPNSNGTILTREELNTKLTELTNNYSNETFTDPKLPGFRFYKHGGIASYPTTVLVIKIGKSSQAVFRTLSECIKYLSKYNFSYYSNTNRDLIHVWVEDGTDFGEPINLYNVDLKAVVFTGSVEGRSRSTVNVPTFSTSNYYIYTWSSILRISGIKFVCNALKGTFCYSGYGSLIYLSNCEFDFRIDANIWLGPNIFSTIDNSYLCINSNAHLKLRIENVRRGLSNWYYFHPIYCSSQSRLLFSNKVEVTFNNCDYTGMYLARAQRQADLDFQYVNVTVTVTDIRNLMDFILTGADHTSTCDIVGCTINPVNFNCRYFSVCNCYENSSANATDLKNL